MKKIGISRQERTNGVCEVYEDADRPQLLTGFDRFPPHRAFTGVSQGPDLPLLYPSKRPPAFSYCSINKNGLQAKKLSRDRNLLFRVVFL